MTHSSTATTTLPLLQEEEKNRGKGETAPGAWRQPGVQQARAPCRPALLEIVDKGGRQIRLQHCSSWCILLHSYFFYSFLMGCVSNLSLLRCEKTWGEERKAIAHLRRAQVKKSNS